MPVSNYIIKQSNKNSAQCQNACLGWWTWRAVTTDKFLSTTSDFLETGDGNKHLLFMIDTGTMGPYKRRTKGLALSMRASTCGISHSHQQLWAPHFVHHHASAIQVTSYFVITVLRKGKRKGSKSSLQVARRVSPLTRYSCFQTRRSSLIF